MVVFLILFSWQQKVNYKIDVEIDTKKHILYGRETIIYTNNSPDTLKEIYIHLYPNAYRKGSVMYKEAEKFNLSHDFSYPRSFKDAYLKVKRLQSERDQLNFSVKGTILHAKLKEPIYPGDTRKFHIEFEEYIPAIFVRWGRFKSNYHLSQWYPKIAVYDRKGWHPDEFHLYGEFYGDFGDYDVSITVPFKYKIVASGILIDSKIDSLNKRKTERYLIKNSHDFAFCFDKRYKVKSKMVNNVRINLYYFCSEKTAERALKYAVQGLKYYESKYGEYGYREMDVVETEPGPGGMEYPGLVMLSKQYFELPYILDYLLEDVIVHEIGHNWWYGVIANNETDEAWLDEGINTFSDKRYTEDNYGVTKNLLKYPEFLSWLPNTGIRYIYEDNLIEVERRGYGEEILKSSYKYREGTSYSEAVYIKASLMMDLLRDSLGEDKFNEVMQVYYKNYKYRLVSTEDFIKTVNEVTGEDWEGFFDYWLRNKEVDYKRLIGLNNSRRRGIRIVPIFGFPKGEEVLITFFPYAWKMGDTTLIGNFSMIKYRTMVGPTITVNSFYQMENKKFTTYTSAIIPLYIIKRPVRNQYLRITMEDIGLKELSLFTSFGPYISYPPYINIKTGYLLEDSFNVWKNSIQFSNMGKISLSGWRLNFEVDLSTFNRFTIDISQYQRIFWLTNIFIKAEYGAGTNLPQSYMFKYTDIPGNKDTTGYTQKTSITTGINFPVWYYADIYLIREYLKLSSIMGNVSFYLYNIRDIKDFQSINKTLHITFPITFTVWNILRITLKPGYIPYPYRAEKGMTFDLEMGSGINF